MPRIEKGFETTHTGEGALDEESYISRYQHAAAFADKRTFANLRLEYHKAIRKFRMSRIVSAKLTNEKYKIPLNFNKREYLWIFI